MEEWSIAWHSFSNTTPNFHGLGKVLLYCCRRTGLSVARYISVIEYFPVIRSSNMSIFQLLMLQDNHELMHIRKLNKILCYFKRI